MSQKTDKKPLYLLVVEERRDGYYHLRGRCTTQRYENGAHVPYGVDDDYSDGLLWSGLEVRCQGDERSASRGGVGTYGFDVEYRDVYSVDLRKVKRMHKTLEKVERGLDKLRETRGYVQTYGDYCGRVAEVLGCVGMGFDKGRVAAARVGYQYDWLTVGEGVNRVNRQIAIWVESLTPAPAEALPAASCRLSSLEN